MVGRYRSISSRATASPRRPGLVTHRASPPHVTPNAPATGYDLASFEASSIRATAQVSGFKNPPLPSASNWLAQIEPPPALTDHGCSGRSIVAVTLFDFGSIRLTDFPRLFAVHTASLPTTTFSTHIPHQ